MKLHAFAAAALAATAAASATAMQIAPPPLPTVPRIAPVRTLVSWQVDRVSCGGVDLPSAAIERPQSDFGWTNQTQVPVVYNFTVNAAGRAIDIRRAGPARYVPNSDDLGPALAASEFAPGSARTDCQVIFSMHATPIADAAVQDLIAATVMPLSAPPREAYQRIQSGGDCFNPAPAALLRAYPDFARLPVHPGKRAWSMVRFDIDSAGKPVAAKTLSSTGDQALDVASRDAVVKSRFATGKRTGCLYPYWRRASRLDAPEAADKATLRPEGANCPTEIEWATKPMLSYPANYRRRAIEGWAVISFDAAPWGQTGNFRVLAAEPAAEFGEAAINIIRAATVAKSGQGYTGCVERVRYVMARTDSGDTPAN